MLRMMCSLALLGLFAGPAVADDRPAKPEIRLDLPAIGIGATAYTWPSGLVTVLEADPMSTAVSFTVLIGGGWSADPEGKAGLTRLFERAWWNSEVSDGVRVVDQMVNGYGCSVDSTVSHDAMRFSFVCPRSSSDAAMSVVGRLFSDPFAGLDQADLDREKARVRSDATVRAKLASAQVQELVAPLLQELFPPGHPYHRTHLGDLDSITLDDLKSFATSGYKPSDVTLTLLGGFDDGQREYGLSLLAGNVPPKMLARRLTSEHMQRFAKGEYDEPDEDDPSHWWVFPADPDEPNKSLKFGDPRPARVLRHRDPVPEPGEAGPFRQIEGGVDQSMVMVGWSLAPSWQADDAKQRVLARLITRMVGQNLDDPYIDQFPGCYIVPGLQGATLTCVAILKEGQESSGERIARRIVDQLTYVTDIGNKDNVEVAVGQSQVNVLASSIWSFDALGDVWDSRAYWLSSGVHFAGDGRHITDIVATVSEATFDTLIDLTEAKITRARSRAVQLLPFSAEEVAIRDLADNARNRDQTAVQGTYWDRLATRPAPLPRPAEKVSDQRIAGAWSSIPESNIRTDSVGAGVEILAISQPELPMAHYRLMVTNGRVNDASGIQAHHYGREFVRPSKLVRTEPPGFGAQFAAWRDDVHHSANVRASAANTEQALWVLRELADGWRVVFTSKGEWMRDTKTAIVDGWYDVNWHAASAADAHLFGDSPIGDRVSWDDMVAWDELASADVKDMLQAKWRPDNSTVMVVGPQDPDEMVRAAARQFEGWRMPAPSTDKWNAADVAVAPMPTGRKVQVMQGEGELYADVRLSCRVDASPELREAAEHVVRRSMDGPWLSVVSDVNAWPGGTASLDIMGRVATADAGEAVASMVKKLEGFASGLDDAAARGAAWRGAMDSTKALSSYRLTIARTADILGEGRDWEDEATLGGKAAAVNAASLQPVVNTCATTMYMSVIGDGDAVAAALSAAGIEHEQVDWLAAGKALHQAADPKGFAKAEKKRAKEAKK